jgi:hypothetical protein
MLGKRLLMLVVVTCLPGTYSSSQGPQEPSNGVAQGSEKEVTSADKPSPQTALRIDAGDILEVKVYTGYEPPHITQSVRVSSTGDMSLPLVGRVPVGGLTAEQAQSQIEEKLREGQYLRNPHVSVFVTEYATQGSRFLARWPSRAFIRYSAREGCSTYYRLPAVSRRPLAIRLRSPVGNLRTSK